MATASKKKTEEQANPEVEQLQAQLENKEAQVTSLTQRTQELGAFQQEAMKAREDISALEKKLAETEAERDQARAEAAAHKNAAANSVSKGAADSKKVDAAQKVAEGLRVLLGA